MNKIDKWAKECKALKKPLLKHTQQQCQAVNVAIGLLRELGSVWETVDTKAIGGKNAKTFKGKYKSLLSAIPTLKGLRSSLNRAEYSYGELEETDAFILLPTSKKKLKKSK